MLQKEMNMNTILKMVKNVIKYYDINKYNDF